MRLRRWLTLFAVMACLVTTSAPAQMRWKSVFGETFYQSATVVITGNTGIIATPGVATSGKATHPLFLQAIGTNMLTDETNVLTIAWYANSTGAGGAIGTTTFDQLTAGSLTDLEVWPGDVTAYAAGRDLVPLPPYMQITHTLAGTTKSMEYTLLLSYMVTD